MRRLEDEATPTDDRPTTGPVGRVVLAALLAGAAGTHFAMAPAHADEWLAEGIAFAATGWAQVVLAVAGGVRPSRRGGGGRGLLHLAGLRGLLPRRDGGVAVGARVRQGGPVALHRGL